jgi:hypothetical protein
MNDRQMPLTHQDVEEEVRHLSGVYDRLPECAAADAARRHLELSEEAAHRAVEGGREASAEAGQLG